MSAPAHPDDPGGLRIALNWFHTWFGLVVGALLFIIFWTGTLAVFDREIDRWTMPATRLPFAGPVSADALEPVVRDLVEGSRGWRMILPDERVPVAEVQASFADGSYVRRFVDPVSMQILPDQGTAGATDFFYPYHYNLHSGSIGLFLCALAAVIMVALCISGVIIHHKIFADFFTLRIVRKPQRTTLDLHNLSGVLFLPFLLMISCTGVAIFTYTYLPSAQAILFKDDPQAMAAGYFSREAVGKPGGPPIALETLRDQGEVYWGARPNYVQIVHPDDAKSYIELRPPNGKSISFSTEAMWFDAATGARLGASPSTGTRRAYDFLYGIHLVQFDHWPLRWLYFLSGLAGCLLIATGMLFWVQSRRKRHAREGLRGIRFVEGFAVAATVGPLLATLGFFIANRVLPITVADRASTEIWMFHLVWIASAVHALARGHAAWREQAWMIAAGCILALALNALTTDTGLFEAISAGLWHSAGVDLFLLAAAILAAWCALKLRGTDRAAAVSVRGVAE